MQAVMLVEPLLQISRCSLRLSMRKANDAQKRGRLTAGRFRTSKGHGLDAADRCIGKYAGLHELSTKAVFIGNHALRLLVRAQQPTLNVLKELFMSIDDRRLIELPVQ